MDADHFSEDEEDKELRQQLMQEQRFGHQIQTYKITNTFKIIAIVSAILIIPLQQFLKIQLQEIENDWITWI